MRRLALQWKWAKRFSARGVGGSDSRGVRESSRWFCRRKWKQRWVRGAASGGGAGRLPAWIEATEADPAHGPRHGSAGRAAGALAEADGSEREWQSQLVPPSRYRRE